MTIGTDVRGMGRFVKPAFWLILGLMTLSVFVYTELPFVDPANAQHERHVRMGAFLGLHALLGTVAILAGPVQFSSRVRRRFPELHRRVGWAYVVSVLVAAPLGIAMARVVDSPLLLATCVQAGAWFVTTLAAFLTARNGYFSAHRAWMIRSYAVTFTFILLRVLNPWPVWKQMPEGPYSVVMVTVTLLSVLVPDLIFSTRELTRSKV